MVDGQQLTHRKQNGQIPECSLIQSDKMAVIRDGDKQGRWEAMFPCSQEPNLNFKFQMPNVKGFRNVPSPRVNGTKSAHSKTVEQWGPMQSAASPAGLIAPGHEVKKLHRRLRLLAKPTRKDTSPAFPQQQTEPEENGLPLELDSR